jgi:hypothetical protein
MADEQDAVIIQQRLQDQQLLNQEQEVELQGLRDQVQDALDAAAAAAAPPPAGAQPAPVPFALTPALANSAAAYLNLASASGAKQFKGATEPLTSTPFDFADPSDLQIFLDLVLKKSQVYGWNPILTIPVTDPVSQLVKNRNLLDEYGVISLADITTHVTTYYDSRTKRAQDSFMACQCLLSSLSLDFLKLISAEAKDYHLPAIIARDGPIPCGPLLLKLIISKAHVDSRATVMYIRTSLCELDKTMLEFDSNILQFNLYVKSQVKNLAARGESSNDLLNNLFKGYKVAADSEFQDFIKRRENEYEEGHDVGVNNLMADAVAKYRARVLSKKWSAPTKEQDKVIALTAQVEQLKANRPDPKVAKKKPPPKKGKNPQWAWKDVMPKEGEPTTKDFNGKHYHIGCKYHPGRWVCHTSEECSKNPDKKATASSASTAPAKDSNKKGSRQLKKAQLAAALLEQEEDSEEDDSDAS